MYNAKFVTDTGTLWLGYDYGIIFDISDLSGVSVDISTSQGYNQTGVTVQNRSVGGFVRTITGKILGDPYTEKQKILQIFKPMASGKLYFEEDFYCDCVVKTTPLFGVGANKRTFTVELFCAFPYWLSAAPSGFVAGGWVPAFSFPVNYAHPHRFGVRNPSAFVNCKNLGVVDVPYRATFTAEAPVEGYGIENALTGERILVNDTLNIGDKVVIYRENGVLRVEKNGEDIFDRLDEESDLYFIRVGDNQIKSFAGSNADSLRVQIEFSNAYSGVYDGMQSL